MVDDVKHEGENVINGFATYFEKLAAPNPDTIQGTTDASSSPLNS
jgi:hypothetical protein